jgi:chromosome segregation ATPase
MFMYEMKRDAEVEKLFHGHIFELARIDDVANDQQKRITELEEIVTRLADAAKNKGMDERLATSQIRLDQFAARIAEHADILKTYADALAAIKAHIQATPAPTQGLNLQERTALEAKIERSWRGVTHATVKQAELENTIKQHDTKITALTERQNAVTTENEALRTISSFNTTALAELKTAVAENQEHSTNTAKLAVTANTTGDKALRQCATSKIEYTSLKNGQTLLKDNHASLKDNHAALKADCANHRADQLTLQTNHATLWDKHSVLHSDHSTLKNDHSTVKANVATLKEKHAALKAECATIQANHAVLQSKVDICDRDIGVLFDERDALAEMLKQAVTRIDKQDGLIRALTMQRSPPGSSAASSPTLQVLPVSTSNGDPLNLRVPKGQPFGFAPHHKSGRRDWGSGSSDSL